VTAEPVAGTGSPIDSEVERLTLLRDDLIRAADRLRHLRIPGWTGATAEAFDAVTAGICRELYRTADLHEDAAKDLADYRSARGRVAALVSGILAQWPRGDLPADVAEQVAALHAQVDEAGHLAAVAIRPAAAALHDVRQRLRGLAPDERRSAIMVAPAAPIGPNGNRPIRADPPTTAAHRRSLAAIAAPRMNLDPATKHALLTQLRESTHFVIEDC